MARGILFSDRIIVTKLLTNKTQQNM